MLPATIRNHLETAQQVRVVGVAPCSGGDINEARRLETADGPVFIKWNNVPIAGMFSAEARGLSYLGAAGAVRVPQVIAVFEGDGAVPPYLLLEWLETGSARSSTATQLGEQIATLHQNTATTFGLDHANFIGALPQSNHQHPSWRTFFVQQRLKPQVDIARRVGQLSDQREQRLAWLIAHIDRFVPDDVVPSLLHGDLWRGNVMTLHNGQPALIDPAIYYGHFEIELAFTELFTGFSAAFYDAYWANVTFDRKGYIARRALYQLYPLLVHLNLFGGSYAQHIDTILDQLGIGQG